MQEPACRSTKIPGKDNSRTHANLGKAGFLVEKCGCLEHQEQGMTLVEEFSARLTLFLVFREGFGATKDTAS